MWRFITYGFIFSLLSVQLSYGQISPGELSEAHKHLEGISNCTKCHILGEKETTSNCLECHAEIQNLITNNKGYHVSVEIKDKKCASCHGEHFGRDFTITKFDTTNFSHNLAGFELVEKHNKLNCNNCHNSGLIANKISQKKKGLSFLGLGTECLSCHDDYHQNSLPNNCTTCHSQTLFKPAPFFKHEKTNFPLLGKHKNVDCAKCHIVQEINGNKFQQFSKIQYSNCTNCHEDVHKNKFGNTCTKCHTVESFHKVKNLNNFNHSKTNYPLEGKHQYVDCSKCHTGSYTSPVKHSFCLDCHEDFHEGQFNSTQNKPDCSDCHTIENFTQTTYSIDKHNLSTFKLKGSHLATPCAMCHKKEEKWAFKNLGEQCADCHDNVHKNTISDKYMVKDGCLGCHNEESWNQANFNHKLTNFPLLGKHEKVDCHQCHFSNTNEIIMQEFKGLDQNCYACHKDVHNNQFDENNHTNCKKCHTNNNWEPDKFNHDSSRFKLEGKHISVDCKKCHKINPGPGNYIVYKFKDISCKSCHI